MDIQISLNLFHLKRTKSLIRKGLLTLDSTAIDLLLFKDKTTLLQFSFKGCGLCERAKQIFPSLLDETPDNFQIITLSIDKYNLWKQINHNKDRWIKINIGDSDLRNSLKIIGYPTYFVINEEGKIISRTHYGIARIRNLYQMKPDTNLNLVKEYIGELKYRNSFWRFIFISSAIYSILFGFIKLVFFLIPFPWFVSSRNN